MHPCNLVLIKLHAQPTKYVCDLNAGNYILGIQLLFLLNVPSYSIIYYLPSQTSQKGGNYMYQKILKRVRTGMCAHTMHGMTIIL